MPKRYSKLQVWISALSSRLSYGNYGFRNCDPQIARFTQLDPLRWDYPDLTNYQYGSNDPIANVDWDGLERASSTLTKGAAYVVLTENSFIKEIVATGLEQSDSVAAETAGTATLTLSLLSEDGNLVRRGGAVPVNFGKKFWSLGVTQSITWFNCNINPIHSIFNGINSQS